MSLLSYGLFALGVVLGGIVLLVILSLLAMAQKGDAHLEQLESKILQRQDYTPPLLKEAKTESLREPADSDLNHGEVMDTRILISR